MVLTIDCPNKDQISLEDYIDFCNSGVDLHDPDTLVSTAPRLKALCNNRTFLADFIDRELRDIYNFQLDNMFKPATFMLYRGKGYTIRAVTWLPEDQYHHPGIFSYYDVHDHNFDFLTCGYHGSGYRTEIFEYDHEAVVGYTGEPVELRFVELTSLPVGKVMFYAASKDVHTQLPPEEMSISINLIVPPKNRHDRHKAQYYFDNDTHTVQSHFVRLRQRRRIFNAVRHIGREDTFDLTEAIARNHSDPRTRVLAYEALVQGMPDRTEEYLRAAAADSSDHVKTVVRQLVADRQAGQPTGSAEF